MSAAANKNWVRHLLHSRFTPDVAALVERISTAAAAADGGEAPVFAEQVLAALEAKFGQFIQGNYGSLQEIKTFLRERTPSLVTWVKNRPRYFIGRQRSALCRQLIEAGASGAYVAQFRAELAAIEDVLSGEAFAAFVRPYLPVLRTEEEAGARSITSSVRTAVQSKF
jgi:hypothetical protein